MIKLNPNIKESENHYIAVKDLLKKRIKTVIEKGGIIKEKKDNISISNNLSTYLLNLLVEDNLRRLILLKPDTIKEYIPTFKEDNPDFCRPKSDDNLILRNIFINHGYEKIDKLNFIQKLSIDTCPYCNRNYIYHLPRSSKIKPQIDHFYPTSTYPFLALSYFNLIPSCQTCNGFGAKDDEDPITVGLVNPYLLSNDDFRFSYKIKNINIINPLTDKNSVEVVFEDKIQGHLNVFKLDKLYAQHSDHVLELILKSRVLYAKKYKEYLKSYAGLNFGKNEIDRMILGNYSTEKEIHKRPLSKLYQDIAKEIKLIE